LEGVDLSQIERVIVIGAGWVGRQVAAKLAASGLHVGLVDRTADMAMSARQWMSHCVDSEDPLNLRSPKMAPANAESASSDANAIHHQTTDVPAAMEPQWLTLVSTLAGLDELTKEQIDDWQPQLALECVPEQLSLKKRVLRRICQLVSEDCIVASNTSYFVPSVLSKFVSRPERFAQMHFHVPVLRNSVADIVGCEQTSIEVLNQLVKLADRVGQYPLLLRHEHPGYVFNWLLQAVLKAALELVAQDVVDASDVDRSWKSVTGMTIGPFGLMDQIGLDVIDQVLSNARWAPPNPTTDQQLLKIIRPLIQQGKLGIKSGAGFYNYRQP
jgi:3-hydroxybutyryl-CoA dehydrogenase